MTKRSLIFLLLVVAAISVLDAQQRVRIRSRPNPPGGGGGGGEITTYNWQTTGWSTFGLPLKPGLATDGVQVGNFPTQTDVKVRHGDGTIKHAIVTVFIPTTGSYAITASTASTGSFSPVVPSASAVFTVAGNTHTATAPSTLSTDCWLDGPLVKECRDIVTPDNSPTGAFANVRVYFDRRVYNDGKSRVDGTVDNTKNLSTSQFVKYSVDLRVNGVSQYAKTLVDTPKSGTLTDPAGNFTATMSEPHGLTSADEGTYVQLTSGTYNTQYRRIRTVPSATTVTLDRYFPAAVTSVTWSHVNFIHSLHARWRKVFPANGLVEADIVPDFQTLFDAKATYPLLSTITSALFTGNTPGTLADSTPYVPFNNGASTSYRWDILGIGNWTKEMSNPGGREELGFRPMVTSQYLVHRTQSLRKEMLRYGDLAGSRRMHFTNASNQMITVGDLPDFSTAGTECCGNGITAPAGGGPAPDPNNGYSGENGPSHQPSAAFIPYLVTGDRYYLDELKSWTEYGTISWGTSGRTAANVFEVLIGNTQVRQWGWAMRDLTDCAAWLPDADPHKTYYGQRIVAFLDELEAYSTAMTDDPLQSRPLVQATTLDGVFQGWMQTYLVQGYHHAVRNGFISTGKTTDTRDRIVDYWITRMMTPATGWSVANCCPYYLFWREGSKTAPAFTSIQAQYDWNAAWVNGTTANGIPVNVIFPTQGGVCDACNPRYGEHRVMALVGLEAGRPNALAALTAIEAYMNSNFDAPTTVTWFDAQLNTMQNGVGPSFAYKRFDQ